VTGGDHPLRVCTIFSTAYPPEEGIGNYVQGLAKQLLLRGHELVGITRGPTIGREETCSEGFRVIKAPFVAAYPFHVQLHSLAVRRAIATLGGPIDLFHIHSPLPPVPPRGIPVVSTFHTMMLEELRHLDTGGLRPLLARAQTLSSSRRIEMNLIRRSTCVTAVSEEVRGSLAEYNVNPRNVEVVYNGVDTKVFCPSSDDRIEGRILFVGRLDLRKGLYDLLEALKLAEIRDLELLIVGKGPLEVSLSRHIQALSLSGQVRLVGHVPRPVLVRLYQTSEMFVLPSRYEGLPTVLLEAMSCGAPCISAAVGGVPEIVTNQVDGVMVPPASPTSLASAIRMLHEDPGLRADLGNEARRKIVSRFDWSQIASKFERIYADALNRP